MDQIKSICTSVFALALLSGVAGETINWRMNPGQQFEAKTTIQESIRDLRTVTVKPETTASMTIEQDVAASRKSTLENLEGIPSFPDRAISVGDTWNEAATATYDLKKFGIDEPLKISVDVRFKLLGTTLVNDLPYYRISAEWFPFRILDAKTAKRSGIARISGHSSMDILWDNRSGGPKKIDLSEETQFRFSENSQIILQRRTVQDFKTVAEILREKAIKQISEQIKAQAVEHVEVKQSDEGIVLSVENIQFDAESATLSSTEKAKIDRIGKLLAPFANRKISVVGHAASTPDSTEEELVRLSAERAQAVANYLAEKNFKPSDMIVASGMGGSKPLASNDTAEGRSKNRRVEIVILDEEAQQ